MSNSPSAELTSDGSRLLLIRTILFMAVTQTVTLLAVVFLIVSTVGKCRF